MSTHSSWKRAPRRTRAAAAVALVVGLLASLVGTAGVAASGAPSITIADASVVEGDAGATTASFTVVLSEASVLPVTVNYAVTAGTAVADSDFLASSGTVTFLAGQTRLTVPVAVLGDMTDEVDETFLVTLSSPRNATIADGQATGTIIDDDAPPTLTVDNPNVTEGNAGTVKLGFTLSLSQPSGKPVSVAYETADNTATASADYVAASSTASFASGDTSETVEIDVKGDALDEANETFSLVLSNPLNATLREAAGVGTIRDDDAAPSLTVANPATVTEGDAGAVPVTFTVTLSAPSGQQVTVGYATANGTATAPGDYSATSGTLTFAPGDTSETVEIDVEGDALDEVNETFVLNLSSATNATVARAQALATITDDDGTPQVSVDDVLVAEGHAGPMAAVFTVTLSPASGRSVKVDYATALSDQDQATAGVGRDYLAASGTLTFAPGETSRQVSILVNGDTTDEKDELFLLKLPKAVDATVADGVGVATIDDDDGPLVSVADRTALEDSGAITFTVSLSAASPQPVTVRYDTADGTATAPDDYAASTGTVTFPARTTSAQVSVTVRGDDRDEADETLTLRLSDAVDATILDGEATGTITDDDAAPTVGFEATDARVGEADGAASLRVKLSAASGRTVTVDYATVDGTATAADDHAGASGTLSFAPGETSKTVAVALVDDAVAEPTEQFAVSLSSPSQAGITTGAATATVTVIDDEAQPTISVSDAVLAEGNTGQASAVFTVTLSGASAQDVTATVTSANGTAAAPGDYAAFSGSVTVAAGSTSATFAVIVEGDTVDEVDESFTVTLSAPPNAMLAKDIGTATVVDDDGPSISVADVSAAEGTGIADVTVTLSAPSPQPVTVLLATANGSATAGSDYGATSVVLSFTPGDITATARIGLLDDGLDEDDEVFTANLSSATNATILDPQGIVTVSDDDAPPTVGFLTTTAEVGEGAGTVRLTVQLSAPSAKTIEVSYGATNGTAGALDYTLVAGTLSFAPGETQKQVVASIVNDGLDEADESFSVSLSASTNVTLDAVAGTATVTIADDDGPSISIDDATAAEGAGATTATATFTLTLSTASTQDVHVGYTTRAGTATEGDDYAAASGTVTFPAGTTSAQVSVIVRGDDFDEADETFFVVLSGAQQATVADSEGVGTVADDDDPPAISIAPAAQVLGETDVTVELTVSLSGPSGRTVTVRHTTVNGTAAAPGDYGASSATLTFAPGETSKTVSVAVQGDTLDEVDEAFTVELSDPAHAVLAPVAVATVSITDDDGPSISMDDVTVAEGTDGTTTPAAFTLTLSAASPQDVQVDYSTRAATATEGDDYAAAAGTVTFPAGTTTAEVPVTVRGDDLDEPDETFTVVVAGARQATVADGDGIGTVADDDDAPSISIAPAADGVAEANATVGLTVSLSRPSGRTVTVRHATVNGTAVPPGDYEAASGTLTFAPGETSKAISVEIKGDALDEADEAFTVELSDPAHAVLGSAVATVTITDDDGPSISIDDVTAVEGNSGTAEARFTVSLSSASPQAVTVAFATADGSATAGGDYRAVSGTLSFAPGEQTKAVHVVVNGDTTAEADETFSVTLSMPVRATLADARGVGTITNDDIAPTVPAAPTGVTATRGNASATVSWTPPTDDGGSAVTGYRVTASPGGATETTDGTARTVTVGGLTNGITYTFTVAATNAVGTGSASLPSNPVTPEAERAARVSGDDRMETAVAISKASFGADLSANAVVLAKSTSFPDALAGTPLAVAKGGPLLLTPTEALDARTMAEIQRVLPSGKTVYLLGGTSALSPSVASELSLAGYDLVRYAGADRYETATIIAEHGLWNPSTLLLATGLDFPDALGAGAAAAKVGGAVLLTAGSTMPDATAAYLDAHGSARRYALGGPAAQADPGATAIVGADRYETSTLVAAAFFSGPTTTGVASGANFPDALAGGAHIARLGGPLVLSAPDALPGVVRDYLVANRSSLSSARLYGGAVALSDQVSLEVAAATD